MVPDLQIVSTTALKGFFQQANQAPLCRHFLKQALNRAYDCRKAYYLYTQQGAQCEVNCSDVVLFWRIQQVIKVTANALRQQVVNREARRLDKEIKEVLDEYGEDDDKKQQLLTGKRVTLAEELSKIAIVLLARVTKTKKFV